MPSVDPPQVPLSASEMFPPYAERFRCIGGECEDSCCKAWDLRLDRATYERYQLIPAESLLGRVVATSVVAMPEPRTDPAYGRILLNEALECPFLTETKMCAIQQQMGEEALSRMCRTYPRVVHELGDGCVETTLHLSCPEAARVILLDAEGAGGAFAESYCQLAEVAWREETVLQETRRFLRRLLRDRRYSPGERVWLMGQFAVRLRAWLTDAGSVEQRAKPLRDFCLLLGDGAMGAALDQVAAQPAMQIAFVLDFVNRRLGRAMNSLRFLDGVKAFLDGIGYRPGLSPESLVPAFERAEREWYTPWMEAHPWVLENYLLHAVDRSLFPLGAQALGGRSQMAAANPEQEFQALCAHFVVLRTLLVGVAGARGGEFAAEDVVWLVQAYSRMVDHHAEFLAWAAGALGERGATDAGSLAALLLEGVDGGRGKRAGSTAMA